MLVGQQVEVEVEMEVCLDSSSSRHPSNASTARGHFNICERVDGL